jgi:hypothetical protein
MANGKIGVGIACVMILSQYFVVQGGGVEKIT